MDQYHPDFKAWALPPLDRSLTTQEYRQALSLARDCGLTRLDDRRGVRVQTGFVGTQFTEGKVTIRADLRAAFTVTRPAAACQITGI